MFTTYITSALFGPITGDCLLIHTTKHTHTRRLKTLTTFLSQSQSLSSRKPPDFLALAVRAATAAASASTKPRDELVDNDFGVRVELLTKTLVVSSSEFHGARVSGDGSSDTATESAAATAAAASALGEEMAAVTKRLCSMKAKNVKLSDSSLNKITEHVFPAACALLETLGDGNGGHETRSPNGGGNRNSGGRRSGGRHLRGDARVAGACCQGVSSFLKLSSVLGGVDGQQHASSGFARFAATARAAPDALSALARVCAGRAGDAFAECAPVAKDAATSALATLAMWADKSSDTYSSRSSAQLSEIIGTAQVVPSEHFNDPLLAVALVDANAVEAFCDAAGDDRASFFRVANACAGVRAGTRAASATRDAKLGGAAATLVERNVVPALVAALDHARAGDRDVSAALCSARARVARDVAVTLRRPFATPLPPVGTPSGASAEASLRRYQEVLLKVSISHPPHFASLIAHARLTFLFTIKGSRGGEFGVGAGRRASRRRRRRSERVTGGVTFRNSRGLEPCVPPS